MEKLSPKESVEGADTVLRGSVRAPQGFSEGKPEAAKPRGLPEDNPEGALTLTRKQGFSKVAQTTKIMRFTGK